jgi:putative endonuclease
VRELPGELDLVVAREGLLVFCEVKARQGTGYGGAAGAVDDIKQARIRALAAAWLADHEGDDVDVRFDVIAIDGVELTHLESAF